MAEHEQSNTQNQYRNHIETLFDKNYEARKAARLKAARLEREASQATFTEEQLSEREQSLERVLNASASKGSPHEQAKSALISRISFDEQTKTCPNTFVTLVFNAKEMHPLTARAKLREFWNAVQELTFGRGWRTRKDTSPAWFCSEHEAGNFHFHGVCRLTKRHMRQLWIKAQRVDSDDKVKVGVDSKKVLLKSARIEEIWNQIAPAGSIELRRINNDGLTRTIGYMLKDVRKQTDFDSVVVAPHFDAGLR